MRPRLEELLAEAPRWTGGKQQLTAARLHELLVGEGLVVSDRVVPEMVAEASFARPRTGHELLAGALSHGVARSSNCSRSTMQ